MKVMWIGHGGLLFVSGKNKVLVDPYLSNSLRQTDIFFRRRKRIKRRLFLLRPDVIVLSSSHPDRADLKTVSRVAEGPFSWLGPLNFFNRYRPTILASEEAFRKGISTWSLKGANFTMFEPGVEWSLGDMTIKAVNAYTDDYSAFGLIITDNEDGKKYYVASNTLYSDELIKSLPSDIFAAFIPIGGTFGSMNVIDASRFAKAINAEYAVPVQFGTLDRVKPEQFIVGGRIIPKIYKVIDFNAPGGPEVSKNGIDFFFNEKKSRNKSNGAPAYDDVYEINTEEAALPMVIDKN